MLSRVAENLYWLARYMERAENTARMIQVNANLVLDLPGGVTTGWAPLIRIVEATEAFEASGRKYGERGVIAFLVGDYDNPCSIVSSIALARENARTVRDMIPRELWEHVNDLHLYAREHLKGGLARRERHQHLQYVIEAAQAFTGILEGTMIRGMGFRFLSAGRYLERADMTCRIVDVRSSSLLVDKGAESLKPYENIQWMSVLKSLTGYQMYRLKKRVRVHSDAVVEFLMLDDEFPRAVYSCLGHLEFQLSRLPNNTDPLRVVTRLQRHLQEQPLRDVQADTLHAYIVEVLEGLGEVHECLAQNYFDPELATRRA
ncbi:MAG: alpha-E domain-containing protein [Gammaproteobacteria bacterium]|nr:MAG: alpha-E domain-containing protein [Gammaproteobacteria bacterium]